MAVLKKVKHLWASARNIHLKNGLNSMPVQPGTGGWARLNDNVGQALKYLNLPVRQAGLDYRVKASTLMETLVAMVLIVIIFMVASMTMNNLLHGNIKQNTELAEERLHALEYQYKNKDIKLPYYEDLDSWEISIWKEKRGENILVTLEAENTNTQTVVTNYITSEK